MGGARGLDAPGFAWDTCDEAVNFRSVLASVCCAPCMYGNAMDKAWGGRRAEGDGVLAPTGPCFALTCLWLCVGGLAPCSAGIVLRTSQDPGGSQDFFPACLAETCAICSCAPCQMHRYLADEGELPVKGLRTFDY